MPSASAFGTGVHRHSGLGYNRTLIEAAFLGLATKVPSSTKHGMDGLDIDRYVHDSQALKADSALSQVAESGESIVLPQRGTPESMDNWSNDREEFIDSFPSRIGHYDRKIVISELIRPEFTIPAMQTDFNTFISPQTGEEEVLPVGWRKHTHSDGKPYFYHEHDKIITEEWLYDRGLPKRYYFVNHDAECIFWLSKCTLDSYLWEFRGKMSTDFIRNVIMSNTSTVTLGIDKLKTMSKAIFDAESKTSHFINSSVAINRAFTSELDASEMAGKPASYMMALLRDQIYNYHGQRHARTYRDDSVYGYNFHKEKHTVLFRTMNLLLFYAPIKHYTELNKVWVDRVISKESWQRLIEQITDKWQQHIVLVSVSYRTVTQLLCYSSVASSMATIILGLTLTNYHNPLKRADLMDVVPLDPLGSFLERHWQWKIGFERLSIMYSTPYVLIMWSMVSFLASFFLICFEASNPVSLKVFMTLTLLLGTTLYVWCLFLLWDGSDEWIWRCLESWLEALSKIKAALHFLSYDNIRRFRDKLPRGLSLGRHNPCYLRRLA
ncbi:hypothetical protein EDD18DRAFT_1331688, partial [Armillaria luteobubalina]